MEMRVCVNTHPCRPRQLGHITVKLQYIKMNNEQGDSKRNVEGGGRKHDETNDTETSEDK